MYDVAHSALYDFIEAFIGSINEPNHPLYGAETLRSLKKNVDEAKKVVRVGCYSGMLTVAGDESRQQQDVSFIIECFATPDDAQSEVSKDEAIDESFGMARALFLELMSSSGQTLNGVVCQVDADEYDKDMTNLGAVERGATYFYGKINPAGKEY